MNAMENGVKDGFLELFDVSLKDLMLARYVSDGVESAMDEWLKENKKTLINQISNNIAKIIMRRGMNDGG